MGDPSVDWFRIPTTNNGEFVYLCANCGTLRREATDYCNGCDSPMRADATSLRDPDRILIALANGEKRGRTNADVAWCIAQRLSRRPEMARLQVARELARLFRAAECNVMEATSFDLHRLARHEEEVAEVLRELDTFMQLVDIIDPKESKP